MLEDQRHEAERSLIEMEKNLVDAWSEVARVRDELAEAKRHADEARKEIKPRSEQKVAEAQTALAEVRAEAEQERELRAELEQRLDTVEQSEREAREALERQQQAAEKAEQRIAELEESLAGARAETERERERRAETERRLEALVAHEADANQTHERQLAESETRRAEAERMANEARDALAREREEREDERKRILAIDEQLQALVASGESGHPAQLKEETTAREEGRSEADERELEESSESVPPLLEAFGPGQPTETTTSERAGPTLEVEDEVPGPGEAAQDRRPVDRGRGRWGRKSQSKSYACAVCKRLPLAHRPKQLTAAGWAIAGEAALCPDCKGLGWQLPEDGGLPFRPSSAGQTSS